MRADPRVQEIYLGTFEGSGMLEVRDIHTYYGDSYVLQGVSLRSSAARCVGSSGATAWARPR